MSYIGKVTPEKMSQSGWGGKNWIRLPEEVEQVLGAGEAFRTFPFSGSLQLIRLSGT